MSNNQQAGMSELQQAEVRSRIAKHLLRHMEQLERDYHRPCPDCYSLGTHQVMQEALHKEILEIKYLLRDIATFRTSSFSTPEA